MVYLDTSSLIRFFTNDEPQKANKIKTLLEKEKEISIHPVVFPELEYVLSGNYGVNRKEIAKIFRFLTSRPNIKLSPEISKAVEVFEKTKLDMADCLIAATSLKGKLASFDKKLLTTKGVKKYW